MRRLLMWAGVDAWRSEVAHVDLRPDGFIAAGTQLAVDPLPYRLDYTLEVGGGWMTRSVVAEVTGESWSRRLALSRHAGGRWRHEASELGRADLPPPGGEFRDLPDAVDCDLGLSPLTNVMPIRRHTLHRRPGATEIVAAWISVPDLGLRASRQRYEHVGTVGGTAVVRYTDLGTQDGFVADLVLDSTASSSSTRRWRAVSNREREPERAGRAKLTRSQSRTRGSAASCRSTSTAARSAGPRSS